MFTDKLRSYAAAKWQLMPGIEHRRHKGLNNGVENSDRQIRRRERVMKRFKSARQPQRFASIHDPIANLFHFPRNNFSSAEHRDLRNTAMAVERDRTCDGCVRSSRIYFPGTFAAVAILSLRCLPI